jgi:ribonuclease HI
MRTLKIFTDGASSGNPGPAGIGAVVINGREIEISQSIGIATNNVAEYKAAIIALEKAIELKAEAVEIYSDSELLVRQLKGIYKVRDKELLNLWEKVHKLLQRFKAYSINYIPREDNRRADRLARQAINRLKATGYRP